MTADRLRYMPPRSDLSRNRTFTMTSPFIDLRATHNDHRFYLPLTEGLCVGPAGHRFMFGGVGMGAAIAAMERTCGRPAIWATAQYLSYARPGSVVDFDVRVPAHGKTVSQARVIAHVGDKEILTVNAALGERPGGTRHQWVRAPDAPPPSQCPETNRWPGQEDGLHGQIEVRVASGADERGGRGGAQRRWPPGDLDPAARRRRHRLGHAGDHGRSRALGRRVGARPGRRRQ